MEGTTAQFLDDMQGFIRDESFAALCRLLADRPMLYRDFRLLAMPRDADPSHVWRLLATLREHSGVRVPYADACGKAGWYSITASLRNDCAQIDSLCGVGSWLDRTLRDRNPFYLLLEEIVGEVSSAMSRDGIETSYETVRSAVCGQREKPHVPAGAEATGTAPAGSASAEAETAGVLASNMLDILRDMDAYTEHDLDEAAVLDIRRRIGRKLDDLPFALPRTQPLPEAGTPFANLDVARSQCLAKVASIAAGSEGDPSEHPLVMALGIDGLFTTCLPFATLNNCTSMIVTSIYLAKHGLPALAFVPLRRMVDEWRRGIRKPPSTGATLAESICELDDGIDFTVHVGATVEMVLTSLRTIVERVEHETEREKELFEALEKDPLVNHRQRAVIQQAMRDVQSTFRISVHQRTTHVAYATARADLVGLEEMDLLDREIEGRAFVFVPRPDIVQRVRRRWLQA